MKRLVLVVAVIGLFMFSLLMSNGFAQVDFCEGNFDYDKDVDGTDASVFKSDFGRSPLFDSCPGGFAAVEKTGQTNSYATGDDGDLEKGVPWPNPRFTDNGDGTVTDNLTGLIWFKNANAIATDYPSFDNDGTAGDGAVTWQHALDYVDLINDGTYHFRGEDSEDDYAYLPISYSGKSFTLTVDFDISEVTWSGGLIVGLFRDDMYEYSDTCFLSVGYDDGGKNVGLDCGGKSVMVNNDYSLTNWNRATLSYNETERDATLEIKDLCTGMVISTLQLTEIIPSMSITKVGMSQYGPNDQTGRAVGEIDNLSLVINSVSEIDLDFSQDPGFTTTDPNDFYWNPGAAASEDCGAIKSDWGLPNRKELFSLVHDGYYLPCLSNSAGTGQWTEGNPFTNVQINDYWTSTTATHDTGRAWYIYMGNGGVMHHDKTVNIPYIWPVRGGH